MEGEDYDLQLIIVTVVGALCRMDAGCRVSTVQDENECG